MKIFDSSPLIALLGNLSNPELMDCLHSLGYTLYVPTKVVEEITKEAEMEEAIHYTKDKKYCFPATAFEKGMMTVAPYAGNKKFTIKLVGCAISVKSTLIDQDGAPCVPITSKKGFKEFKHWVRHNVKFSPLFDDWKSELIIEYPPDMITADDIVTCLDLAGSMVGIGGWRPRCTDGGKGIYGQYKVIDCQNA